MKLFPPRHSAESVAEELIRGLVDGSIALEESLPEEIATNEIDQISRLNALQAECAETLKKAAEALASAFEVRSLAKREAEAILNAAQEKVKEIIAQAKSVPD